MRMRQVQHVFIHELPATRVAEGKMQSTKSYTILLISVVLVGILSLDAVYSLGGAVNITNTGRIGLATSNITYKSEIRGVFGFETLYGTGHNWALIAQTLKQYGINTFFMNDQSSTGRRPDSEISAAIAACHAQGIEYHSVIACLCDAGLEGETNAINSAGVAVSPYLQCPIKIRSLFKANLESYLNTFAVDGIMLDFIRYEGSDWCYCPQCRAAFEAWLGEGPITDWTPFYPDQSRWGDYIEWRTIPVTELVRDIRTWAKAIKPNLKISEAAWTYFQDCPVYWRKYIGQDTGKWIKEGYIDFVAPMMYTSNLAEVQEFVRDDQKYMTGGVEGKIPLLCFLDCSRGATPAEIKAEIDYARSVGIDGWILWRYGGPGAGDSAASYPDVRDYLSILNMPDTFSVNEIKVAPKQTEATISWTTELPATSRVEYNTSSLFTSIWSTWSDMHYWWNQHVEGLITENGTSTIDHSITLTGLSPGTKYYFRVQSQGMSGTAASEVLTFTTES